MNDLLRVVTRQTVKGIKVKVKSSFYEAHWKTQVWPKCIVGKKKSMIYLKVQQSYAAEVNNNNNNNDVKRHYKYAFKKYEGNES